MMAKFKRTNFKENVSINLSKYLVSVFFCLQRVFYQIRQKKLCRFKKFTQIQNTNTNKITFFKFKTSFARHFNFVSIAFDFESETPSKKLFSRFILSLSSPFLTLQNMLFLLNRSLNQYINSIHYNILLSMISDSLAVLIGQDKQKSQLLKQSVLTLVTGKEVFKNVQVKLFDNHLTFQVHSDKILTYKMNFDFDLIFELLVKHTGDEKDKTSEPFGLKFERFGNQLEFLSNQKLQLLQWRSLLEPKLNQRGFHELFKPIKKIGKGNFASVYLVIKYEDKKKYAVKAFSKQGTYQEDNGKESLVNEIQINRKLNHKNLMKLYGVYESQNSIYVQVELLQGGQLYDKIQAKHKFTPAQVKTVMKGLLEGLEYMHDRKIMHRDLKPENIILREQNDFDCVIADFGLATHAEQKQYLFVRCGTPGYVAPQIVNLKDLKAKYDPICDLFSVGVIFHMLSLGKPPFPGSEYNEVLAQNRACKIDFTKEMYQKIPPQWLDLMKRLLQKDPKKRINATQALNHEFFVKDSKLYEAIKNRDSLNVVIPDRKPLIAEDKNRTSMQCDSPLMTTKNKERKNPALLRDDSCLKFKMKENILTGNTDEGDSVNEINSPLLKKNSTSNGSNGTKGQESRFKRMCNNE